MNQFDCKSNKILRFNQIPLVFFVKYSLCKANFTGNTRTRAYIIYNKCMQARAIPLKKPKF